MPSKFVYSITTGRSGTVFLTELLKANVANATVLHERLGFPYMGINCPDSAHSTAFNFVGNVPPVQAFWQHKLSLDAATQQETFIEISHVLAKAGLVENLYHLPSDSEIHLIALKRDIFKIYRSYINRHDFSNPGFTWLFTLDSRYPNTIVDAKPFQQCGLFGNALWYVYEVFARQEYYRLLTEDTANIHFHTVWLEELIKPEGASQLLEDLGIESAGDTVVIPPKQNAGPSSELPEEQMELAEKVFRRFRCDPVELGATYYRTGRTLATPKRS